MCDGSEVSRAEYSLLFDVIGTAYGEGDGSTTFNLPSMAGRTTIGSSASHALGSTGGEESHELTVSELPKDYASIFARMNSSSVHDIYARSGASLKTESSDYTPLSLYGNQGKDISVITFSGDGKAMNVMQPFIVVNHIIYAGR
jgi:microcystin-dependent protein